MKLSGAEIVIQSLIKHGVETVFGYPGGAVLTLYDELYKNSDKIDHVLTAHEQGAAHAADGYARVSGKTGVVIATSGPGATNLVTGIANAYLDSVPLVAITGNVSVPLLGRDSFQEVDITGITKPITKYNVIIKDISTLEAELDKAFSIASSGRPGPVLIDIPKDIQSQMCEYVGTTNESENKIYGNNKDAKACDKDITNAINAIADEILNAKKPFIYAGGGVVSGNACEELRLLAQRISAPVGLSMMGLTALSSDHPLNLGLCGMHGKYASSVAKSRCDTLIVIGARFSDRATGNTEKYAENKRIIHIDIDAREFGKNVTPTLPLRCDAKVAISLLLEKLETTKNEEWLNEIEALKQTGKSQRRDGFVPRKVVEKILAFCDDDTIIATDVGQHQMWAVQYYRFKKERTLLTSGGLGAMGYGLGAAIGGCIAGGRRKTVLFTGDGSFGMNLTELATAVSQKLPITVVVFSNNSLGLPRQWQAAFYGERYSNSTLDRETDFSKLAAAFGAKGYFADNIDELDKILTATRDIKTPIVIDFNIDCDETVLPMIPPGGSVDDIMVDNPKK